jgi:hypothetical protein
MSKRAQLLLTAALLVVFSGAAQVMADDINPAPFRGEVGSTFIHWTYDDPLPSTEEDFPWDPPDVSSFVSGPLPGHPNALMVDPETGDWDGNNPDEFALQVFAATGWSDSFMGREGVLTDFVFGSWDLRNFFDRQPTKEVWMQLTWKPMVVPGVPVEELEVFFEVEGFGGPKDIDSGAFPTLLMVQPDSVFLPDGWIHSTFHFQLEPNPAQENVGMFPIPYEFTPDRGSPEIIEWTIAIDQVVWDTWSFPEPATFALLAAGSSMLLLRRRRS